MHDWSTIVCVDWGKERAKRRAWMADVDRRVITPLDVATTVKEILAYAAARPGRALIGIDAALGIPATYFEHASASIAAWKGVRDFPSWLVRAMAHPGFQSEARSATDWRADRPFIAVPAGPGSLGAFWGRAGGSLLREIDVATGAKCVFIVSGIPGTVGSGTRELWKELAPLLDRERKFGLWPFDGSLGSMGGRKVVLAEIYPRVCYALALAPELPAPLEAIAKTGRVNRDEAVARLRSASWLGVHGVRIDAMDRACSDEDDFDAMISAAGLLRCVIEARVLDSETVNVIEGGILGLASLLPRTKRSPSRHSPAAVAFTNAVTPGGPSVPFPVPATRPGFRCPIPHCSKVFFGSRGGWDAHVASHQMHPDWYPSVLDPERRKELFCAGFGRWFG